MDHIQTEAHQRRAHPEIPAIDDFERVFLEVEGVQTPFVILGLFGHGDDDYAIVCREADFGAHRFDETPTHLFRYDQDEDGESLLLPIDDDDELAAVQHVYEDLAAIWSDEA